MKIYRNLILIVFLFFASFACQQDKVVMEAWQKEANGIWKYQIGPKPKIDLLKAASALPNSQALAQFDSKKWQIDSSKIKIRKELGKIYLEFPLEQDEHLYGLGLQFKNTHRRGRIYNLHVDHYTGKDNGRTHAPVPFYVSSKGYGVFINSARYITAYMGTGLRKDSPKPPPIYDRNTDKGWDPQPESDVVEILIPDESAEIIVFNGASPMEVIQKYNLYTGGGPLPPKWGLGFTYRTHTLYDDKKVLALADEFEEKGFPLDFIGLEPGWMNRSYPCSYEWDDTRFPQPKTFVKALLEKGVRTNLWMNPYVAPKAKLHPKLLPYAGSHNVWNGIVPDYSLEEAQEIFLNFYKENQLDIGVSGLKIDEVDGYDNWLWPDVATFPSGLDAEQMRQVYGLLVQRMISDLYRENNIRTYGLVRGSNGGATRFPFVIYNDYYKHEDFITALINSSYAGVLWTPEARSSKTGEEWLRRMQSVCFSPMGMINAWASGTLPWSYPEVYEEVKTVAQLRMELLPYFYTTFAQYHFEGLPPIRPLPLLEDFIQEGEGEYAKASRRDIKDQYLFGDHLLVAPVFTGQQSRKVLLPKGNWYDFYTGEPAGNGEIIEIATPLDRIPLFVKEGGIIPMIPPRLHAPSAEEKPELIIRHYGNKAASFMLYDDDGLSFDYEKGAYSWTELSVAINNNGKAQGKIERKQGEVFNYGKADWIFMSKN